MSNKDISLNEIFEAIKTWHLESKNFRNDGWYQKHYRDKIDALKKYIDSLDKDA